MDVDLRETCNSATKEPTSVMPFLAVGLWSMGRADSSALAHPECRALWEMRAAAMLQWGGTNFSIIMKEEKILKRMYIAQDNNEVEIILQDWEALTIKVCKRERE